MVFAQVQGNNTNYTENSII